MRSYFLAAFLFYALLSGTDAQFSTQLLDILFANVYNTANTAGACDDDCADLSITCMTEGDSKCKGQRFVSYIYQRFCPLTCKICKPCVTQESECLMPGEECEDTTNMCITYKLKGWCYMRSVGYTQCKKTCGVCADKCVLPELPSCTTAEECFDRHELCEDWAKHNPAWCEDDSDYPDMREICSYSCNICTVCNDPRKNTGLPAK